ncbi:putative membrane protein [Actinomyces sp. oral taxon 175 str. F0384]|nr:putative membrane protein [Actinomyces sp. oral taxon 175 str. F0384]
MPGSGGAQTGHPSGPTAAPGYGRVAPSEGVPAGAVPPAPAAPPASTGQYGLMPAQATTTRPGQPTAGTGPAMPTTTGPVPPSGPAPVAAPQAFPAAPASPSTDRSAASSLNLDGAPVRLEWWERLGGFLLQFRAFRVLTRVRMVLTWVSLLIVAVTLAVSPLARTVLGAWIGCFWIVAVCFWLARGKTVSWGMTSSVFALSMPWAGAVGWLSFQVAAAARVPVDHAASQVVIASVVEELAKLAPICLVTVIAPGRVRRLLIQDWLVLGVACGAGFMAVEEVARRLTYVLGNTPGLQLSKAVCPEDPEGIIECIHAHTFSLWPFADAFPGPVTYAGHAIVTGLVAVSIGLARHLWWRARHHHPAFGVALRCMALGLPLGVLWVAIVDHMATNSTTASTNWFTGERVVKAWGATKGEAPWPIVGTTSSMAGSGQGRGWLLLVMLVVAILLDARVMRLGGYARTLAGPGGGPGTPQGPPGGVAGRWGADVVEAAAAARAKAHRLRLALAQAATSRRPRLFLQAWAEHRIARDLAARRALDAGPHRWATSALAAAAALAGAWIIYTVVPPVVTELNQRLSGLPTFWFAGILDMLAAVWESMSPTEKAALVLFGAAVVFLSGGTLGLAFSVGLGIATALDAARPTAQFMRDPWGTTGHYLDTHNDLEIAADAGLAAMAIIPGGKALRGAGYAAKTAQAAKPVKRFARAQAHRGLNPRAGIHYPGLRTPRPGRSDGGPGLWGEGKNYGSPRSQAYEEQITRVPIEQSYIVNGVEFDGYDGFALIDAKGPGYANPIKGDWSNEPKSTYKTDPETGEVKRVKKGLLQMGKDQVKAVRATGTDTPIQWHIAEKETFDELFNRQKSGEFPAEIELFHTPPN